MPFETASHSTLSAAATRDDNAPANGGSVSIHRVSADGVEIFTVKQAQRDGPVLLLLHGFPSSWFQYRELMPLLADRIGSSLRTCPALASRECQRNAATPTPSPRSRKQRPPLLKLFTSSTTRCTC